MDPERRLARSALDHASIDPAERGASLMTNVSRLSKKAGAAPLATPTDLDNSAVEEVSAALNAVVADAFVLYMKTKNFHWHMSGKHFRDYHLLLDEQAESIEAGMDPLAERVRKVGGETLHSLEQVLKLTSLKESNEGFLKPEEMFAQLIADNKTVVQNMREAHEVCDKHNDVASASLLEETIDAAEKRLWFLFETNQIRDDSAS
jgi:starvation-inducible DNA-binding protein